MKIVTGPVIEARQGEPLEIQFTNRLSEPTLIHWHGLQIPTEMDGTQATQRPSHRARLYGALIVRGADEPVVDREQILVFDDVDADAKGRLASSGGASSTVALRSASSERTAV